MKVTMRTRNSNRPPPQLLQVLNREYLVAPSPLGILISLSVVAKPFASNASSPNSGDAMSFVKVTHV